ncbi:MAG: histidine phosphatase family protein [Candidatus Yanofskybacteria bacterium]|nr:histidine phosphatase family protein [Candidatus Yanofskybacteria bacterium]
MAAIANLSKASCAQCGSLTSSRITGTICILRHGETGMNSRGFIVGSIDDPLTGWGVQQAVITALNFKNRKISFDAIFSSPLSRAVTTATIIAKMQDQKKQPVLDKRLRERCVGELEGQPVFPKMLERFIGEETPALGSESLSSFNGRVIEFLNEINPLINTLIVCHGLTLLAMLCKIKGWGFKKLLKYGVPGNCEPIIFGIAEPCQCGSKFYELREKKVVVLHAQPPSKLVAKLILSVCFILFFGSWGLLLLPERYLPIAVPAILMIGIPSMFGMGYAVNELNPNDGGIM